MKLTRMGEIRRAGQQAGLYNRTLLEAFEKGAQWADENPKDKWMDVSIIPEKYGAYLVVTKRNMMEMAIYRQGEWRCDNGDVAYWMPLPEFPELPENE